MNPLMRAHNSNPSTTQNHVSNHHSLQKLFPITLRHKAFKQKPDMEKNNALVLRTHHDAIINYSTIMN